MKITTTLVAILITLALVLTACGAPAAAPTTAPAPTVAPAKATAAPAAPTTAPAAPTAVPVAKLDVAVLVDKYITAIPDGFYGMAPAAAKEQIDATKPYLLDVRETKEISDTGTIAGSVNIPLRTLTKNLDKLPALDKPIIVYCAVGYRGPIAMEALQLLGYTNVKGISGGYNAWKAANLPTVPAATAAVAGTDPKVDAELFALVDKYITSIPDGFYGMAPAAAKEQIDATKPFLLDVRETKEISDTGTIAGSVNIPLRTLTKNLDKLPKDKASPMVVFCAVGYRGAIAMEALQLLGYSSVKSISGGFTAWKAANLPVVTK